MIEYGRNCAGCRQIYAERKPPGEPPCETCRIEAKVTNEDAIRIYMMVQSQVLTMHNGKHDIVTGINQLAVWAAIDAYGVKDRTGTFERVLRLFHHFHGRES
jgi:hypothetical protein